MTIQELKAELLRLAKLVPAEEWAVYDDNEGMSPPRPLLCIANDIFHNPNDYKEHEQEGAIQLQINCGWPVDADYIVAVQPKNILALLEHVEGLECVLGDRLIELTQQDERIMALEERVTSLRGALRHLHHNAKASGAEMGLALEIAEAALAEQGKQK